MTPNPAYVRAVQEIVHASPYPALIGMKITRLEIDACRIDVPALTSTSENHRSACIRAAELT